MTADRLAFLLDRQRRIAERGHVRVDEVPLLLDWLAEALEEVARLRPVQGALRLEEVA